MAAQKNSHPFNGPNVEREFNAFPEPEKSSLFTLRELIFNVSKNTKEVSEIQETLKWGQPAYLTPQTKSGSTIRLGLLKEGGFAIYTHCQTTIMSDFQNMFPDDFIYEGNRAIHFTSDEVLPLDKLKLLMHRALTYHL